MRKIESLNVTISILPLQTAFVHKIIENTSCNFGNEFNSKNFEGD